MLRLMNRTWSMKSLAQRALTGWAGPRTNRLARAPLGEYLGRLEDRVVPAFGPTGLVSPIAADCDPVAAVAAGPRLASVDTTQSALLNGLLTGLAGAGSGLSLTAVDYNGLANADLNLGSLLGSLQAQLGLATPAEALTADATIGQLLTAAADAAQADGDTLTATIFDNTLIVLGPLAGTIRLGDLLNVDLPPGSLAQAEVNALDLLTGAVQLFNFRNVATTTAPIMINGLDLGPLGSVLNNISLQAQVVEPPVFVVGEAGTQFFSAAVRLKLNVDLVDLTLDTSALLGPITDILDPLNLGTTAVTATATVGQLQLFADVARGSGTIQAINAITNAVTLQATPSIADLYLGTVSDAVFFNRSRPIVPADVTPGTVGSLSLSATVLGIPLPITGLDPLLGITLRAFAEGAAAAPTTVEFTPPYPSSRTIGSSAEVIGNLVGSLVDNLELGVTGSLGILNGLLGTITSTLDGAVGPTLEPVLGPLVGDLIDPALDALGVGIGEMDLTVLGADSPDPATAVNDAVVTLSGRPVTAIILANDIFPNDCPQTVAIAGSPVNGLVVLNADKSVTYTPNSGFLGADTFTYSLTDEHGRKSTATVTVLVGKGAGTNRPPTANPDFASTGVGKAVSVPVLANDGDPDGDPVFVIGTGVPANGKTVVNPNGTVTYTPNAGFKGFDTFTYAIGDGKGGVSAATVTVAVGPITGGNRSPVANPDFVTTPQGKLVGISVLANDTDPDGDKLTVIALSQPAGGKATLNANGSVTYTPAAGFFGVDRFAYTASDGKGGVAAATVTITVPRNNVAPTLNPDAASSSGQPVAVAVLANDFDPDGDALTVSGVTQPANGSVTINPNGTVTYTPNAGFEGADTFTYTAADGFGGSGSAKVTVLVDDGKTDGTNRGPVVNPDEATTLPGKAVTVPVLANDSDPDGDALTIAAVTPPSFGTAVVNTDGTVTYTPAPGFEGTDVFFYSASDGKGGFGTAGVTVRVDDGKTDGNRNPSARPDSAATPVGSPVSVNVLANDSDPDGDVLSVSGVSQPANGKVVVNADGSVTYTPNPGFRGTDTFAYVAIDGRGGAGTAVVAVRVGTTTDPNGDNNPPRANPDQVSIPKDKSTTIAVLANDTDPDGDPLTVAGITPPANGILGINPDGTITYTPRANFVGIDTFTYTASDGQGGAGTAVVTVRVGLDDDGGGGGADTNTPPTVNPDSAETDKDTPVTIPVLDNDTDADGHELTVVGVVQPENGTVVVNPDGTITYTPDPGFEGTDRFGYTAGDGNGGFGTAAVQVVAGRAGPGPVIADVKQYVVGADSSGGPRVTVYNPDGSVRFDFFAYDPNGRFGVNPVMGDINGDGVSDIITCPGFGGGPHIRVLNGKDLSSMVDFFAFDPTFRGGCSIAVGDLTGDGRNDILLSAGPGGGPRVMVIDGTKLNMITPGGVIDGAAVLKSWFAFDAAFGGGVSVAVTDRDLNGVGEIVTGSGPGGPPLVRTWNLPDAAHVSEFLAFDPAFSAGVNVGGRGEFIVIGAGRGAPPQVRVFQGTEMQLISDTLAYEPTFLGGTRVNFAETVDPTKQLFLIGAGVGGGPRIKVLRPNLEVVVPDYFAFEESFRGGVYVS